MFVSGILQREPTGEMSHPLKKTKTVFMCVLGMSNHVRLDIRRFGSGIRIHPKVRIESHRIYETMFAWCM